MEQHDRCDCCGESLGSTVVGERERRVLVTKEAYDVLVEALKEYQDKASVFLTAMEPQTLSRILIINQLVEGFGNAYEQARAALAMVEEPK